MRHVDTRVLLLAALAIGAAAPAPPPGASLTVEEAVAESLQSNLGLLAETRRSASPKRA